MRLETFMFFVFPSDFVRCVNVCAGFNRFVLRIVPYMWPGLI